MRTKSPRPSLSARAAAAVPAFRGRRRVIALKDFADQRRAYLAKKI